VAIEFEHIAVGVGVASAGIVLSVYKSGIYVDWIDNIRDVFARVGIGKGTEPLRPSPETLKWKERGDKIRQSLGIQIIDTCSLK
jgi:hypothetical protein